MIRQVHVSHGRDGYALHVRDIPAWALAAQWAAEHIAMPATFHLLCCRMPGWSWRVGFGERDAEGWRDRNLGSALHNIGSAMMLAGHCREREVYRVPLPFEVVCEKFPECRAEWDDDGVDFKRGVMLPDLQEEHGAYGVIS